MEADSNHTFVFSFSMLEIYLGHLKDLLVPQARKATDPMPPCLSIQTDPNGGIVIENLVAIQVSNFNHAISLYRLGSQLRSTASTNSNKVSSRSHCMIRIFEEGKAINLSLSALGDVINALQRKNSHIPYRNSKLTQVLKDSLGEDSKTLMLVHVSPKEEDLCETVCSLNFALRLRSIRLGKTEPNEARAMRELAMNKLQLEMQEIENNQSYSGSSISRASCLVELNETHLGDNDSVYSHDTDFSSVNVSEANRVYLHNNKRVLPIPPPVQKSKLQEQKKKENDYISLISSTVSTKSMTGVDESYTERDTSSQIMLTEVISDACYPDDYVNGADGTVISQESTHETWDIKAYDLKDDLTANVR
nr:kinesin-like protein KIN-14T [Tanacetum cinerariifolium]